MNNALIRKEKLCLRWKLESSQKYEWDHLIYKKARDYCFMRPKNKYISVYWPTENEVDTIALIDELLKNNFLVCLPVMIDNEKMVMKPIKKLNFDYEYCKNIRQPLGDEVINPINISSYIIPLVAYDDVNHRLGYGMGYYDRYLKNIKKSYKIGLAYNFQFTKKISIHENDVILDRIITEV